MSDQRPRLALPFGLLIAILAVSTASIFIRFAQENAPSLTIAALRITFASLMLAPLALGRYMPELRTLTQREWALAAGAGMFLAVHFATWISSLEFTTVASSVVFVSTGPLWVAVLSPALLKEHLSRQALAGLILALAGGILIGLADTCTWRHGLVCPSLADALEGKALWGNFLALAGAWAVSGYLIIGRKLRSKISLVPYVFVVYSMAALALIVIMLVAGQSPLGYPPATYGWILLMALVPQLIGHSTYNWALRYLPATFVATANLGEPIGSAILAYFLLGETVTAVKLSGAALILCGIYLASQQSR
jgi:drug/metabolite transporter (DMT)-like permease